MSIERNSKKKSSALSKNVTDYKHFLKHAYITEEDINWTTNLRNYEKINPPTEGSSTLPPDVFYKKTKLL